MENDVGYASDQQYELRLHTNQALLFQDTYAAGDFNLPSGQGYLSGWTNNYVEGDDCVSSCMWTGAIGGYPAKIDWAWAGDDNCNRTHDGHVVFVDESDHAWYRAYLAC